MAFGSKGLNVRAHHLVALVVAAGLSLGAEAPLPPVQTTPLEGGRVAFVEVDKAAPAVVFENGLGGYLQAWNKVAPAIAETNTVFAYNRPGVGASTPTDRPRDAAGVVEDLRILLRSRGLTPPYILVGHSMGALDMQLYARRYPSEVAGLVLVDSTHPKSFDGPGSMENRGAVSRAALAVGLSRSAKAEFAALAQSGPEVLSAPPLPAAMPVVIITAPDPAHSAIADYDNAMRKDFANLYPGATTVEVADGHDVPRTHPEVVIAAIREVLGKAGRR
jgi:pimeloyl-ACP methyl ester carboxylesterase